VFVLTLNELRALDEFADEDAELLMDITISLMKFSNSFDTPEP
jgi:hypothetical protein